MHSPPQSFGCIYLGAMFLGTQNGFSVQPLVAYERTVFYRERAARTYAVIPYTIAESLVEIPYCALQVLCWFCLATRVWLSSNTCALHW